MKVTNHTLFTGLFFALASSGYLSVGTIISNGNPLIGVSGSLFTSAGLLMVMAWELDQRKIVKTRKVRKSILKKR